MTLTENGITERYTQRYFKHLKLRIFVMLPWRSSNNTTNNNAVPSAGVRFDCHDKALIDNVPSDRAQKRTTVRALQ